MTTNPEPRASEPHKESLFTPELLKKLRQRGVEMASEPCKRSAEELLENLDCAIKAYAASRERPPEPDRASSILLHVCEALDISALSDRMEERLLKRIERLHGNGREQATITPQSSVIYTDLHVVCEQCGTPAIWRYDEEKDQIRFKTGTKCCERGQASVPPPAATPDLDIALRELSMVMGNPAIEFKAGEIEAGLVRYAAQWIKLRLGAERPAVSLPAPIRKLIEFVAEEHGGASTCADDDCMGCGLVRDAKLFMGAVSPAATPEEK